MTIIISSTDSYQDCWNPFFSLFEKFIEDISIFKIYLITDNLVYNDHSFVKTIKSSDSGKILAWSDRIKFALKQIDDESFLLLMDDYFLYSKINYEKLKSLNSILNSNDKLGSIKIVNHHNNNVLKSEYKNLKTIKKNSSYRVTLQPTMWKKKYLNEILVEGENPWHFEILGTLRSFFVDKSLLVTSNEWNAINKIYLTNGAGGIKKGKWIFSEFRKIESILGKKIITSRGFFSEKSKFFSKLDMIRNTISLNVLFRSFKFILKKIY
tara:strand:- start:2121 stop:2921 length:801 start_codon:yes stop_codon:yes gene_type:complete